MSSRFKKAVGFRLRLSKHLDYYNHNQLWFNYNTKFLGSLNFRGRKLFAYTLLLKLKHALKLKENVDPTLIFLVAMMNVTPEVWLRFIKIGGARYGVPAPISYNRKISYAVKWVIKLLRDKNKTRRLTVTGIADILVASLRNKGEAIQKKEDLYRIASLNRHLISRYLK